MSPFEIKMLLDIYSSPNKPEGLSAPIGDGVIRSFIADDLIEQVDYESYRTTSRGDALVTCICNTALPIQAWVDSYGEIIKERE